MSTLYLNIFCCCITKITAVYCSKCSISYHGMTHIINSYEVVINGSNACHPALSSLSWLFGVWESVEAEVFYPTMETIKYKETMEYLPTMHPVLEYKSETWHPVKKIKLHCERGFLRIDPESNKLALMTSHIFGLNELSEGSVENKTLRLESQSFSKMSFCKAADTVKVIRKLWLKDEDLYYTVDMETVGQPLQAHVRTRYKKKM